ncbi:hypothetical protein [Photobacterium leiognathi]|uniref:hypothetical protein n=1 Tax=Photobacterium leiognathi TaxID=553611 RepID=UPI002738FAF0|nr:hypothetical protein [Photobacterium leiognathi]
MKKTCPCCQHKTSVPTLNQDTLSFTCENCGIHLQHNENQVIGYSITYIGIVSLVLIVLNINAFIAIAIATVSYAMIRRKFIEPRMGLQVSQISHFLKQLNIAECNKKG